MKKSVKSERKGIVADLALNIMITQFRIITLNKIIIIKS